MLIDLPIFNFGATLFGLIRDNPPRDRENRTQSEADHRCGPPLFHREPFSPSQNLSERSLVLPERYFTCKDLMYFVRFEILMLTCDESAVLSDWNSGPHVGISAAP